MNDNDNLFIEKLREIQILDDNYSNLQPINCIKTFAIEVITLNSIFIITLYNYSVIFDFT